MPWRLAPLLVVLLPLGVKAQPKATMAMAQPRRIDNFVPVVAHQSRCGTISDVHGLLAFGHDIAYPDAHVSLVKLDAKGNPASYSIPIKLPRPDSLAKFPSYTVSVAFHPKLPLLYVWQDITLNYSNPVPPQPPDWNKFDHLHIVSVATEKPELLASLCRGDEFIFGQVGGAVAVDPTGSFLYIPNLRELKNAGSLRFGRFPLDAEGLPLLPEVDAKLPLAARSKRLTEVNAAKPVSPPQLTPIEYVNLFTLSPYGCGMSFYPISKDVVIATGYHGLITWRPTDKVVTVSALPLRTPGHALLGAHPNLPVVYVTAYHHPHSDSFFRIDQVEGYLTLLPQEFVLPETKLNGAPVVLAKGNKVAVGGRYFVYLINLDARGIPVGEVLPCPVFNPLVRALAYSEKFDRLYVGVELSK